MIAPDCEVEFMWPLKKAKCLNVSESAEISSVESQKGIITIHKCSVEHQKGALTIEIVQ